MLVPWKDSYDKPMTKTEMPLVIKNPPANAGDIRDVGLIPGREDPWEEGTLLPGESHG